MNDTLTLAVAIARPGDPFEGGIYAGITGGDDGQPAGHLILLPDEPTKRLAWADAVEWAKGLGEGARLPTRNESALLYANVRDSIDDSYWYWTATHFSESVAWGQYFDLGDQHFTSGIQGSSGKSIKARARAVRLIQLTD